MKKKKIFFVLFLFLNSLIINSCITSVYACTNFKISNNQTVYFGNSEDHALAQITETYLSFVPKGYSWFDGTKVKYGAVFVGYGNTTGDSWIQGGMNEEGLAFDLTGVPYTQPNLHTEKQPILVPELFSCATVDEVIEYKKTHSVYQQDGGVQSFFVDKSGESVVINIGENGEFNFYRNNNSYQLATNFYVEDSSRRDPNSDAKRRFDAAEALINNILKTNQISIESLSAVLDAVHFEGPWVNALYSNIFDLTKGDIYMNYFHQTEQVIKLNLEDELAKGRHNYRISDLFTQETVSNAFREYLDYPIMIRIFPTDLLLVLITMILDITIVLATVFILGKNLFKKTFKPSNGALEKKLMDAQSNTSKIGKIFRRVNIQVILSLAIIWSFLSFPMTILNHSGDWWPFFNNIPILNLPLQPFYAYYNVFLLASLLSIVLAAFILDSFTDKRGVHHLINRGIEYYKENQLKTMLLLSIPALIIVFSLLLGILQIIPKIDWLTLAIMYPVIVTTLFTLIPYAKENINGKQVLPQDKQESNLSKKIIIQILTWGLVFLPFLLTKTLDHTYLIILINLSISAIVLPISFKLQKQTLNLNKEAIA